MTTSTMTQLSRRVEALLRMRSFLFDRPGDYMAGVHEALAAIEGVAGVRPDAVPDERRRRRRLG